MYYYSQNMVNWPIFWSKPTAYHISFSFLDMAAISSAISSEESFM